MGDRLPISEVHLMDCMEYMRGLPDKCFELAVVDPPYGIGRDGKPKSTSKQGGGHKGFCFKGWDVSPPGVEYFAELFRISDNQIIWGANYFPQMLRPSMGWVFWDKGQRISQSDGELAFTSFNRAFRVFELNRGSLAQEGSIHPTQKPIALYEWLLKNYAKPGDKILDTHMGSQSSRIAAYKLGFDFYGTEIDEDYFNEGNARFEKAIAMPLFDTLPVAQQAKMFY